MQKARYSEMVQSKATLHLQQKAYRDLYLIENTLYCLKDLRHITKRYDRLDINFVAAIYLVASVI